MGRTERKGRKRSDSSSAKYHSHRREYEKRVNIGEYFFLLFVINLIFFRKRKREKIQALQEA